MNTSLSKYLQKLCHQQPLDKGQEEAQGPKKEEDDLRDGKPFNAIVFKTLNIDHVRRFGNEYTKVYTWVPGSKVSHIHLVSLALF